MKYVSIKNTFWTDVDIEEMTPEDKLFYLYLLTNPNNNQIGLFEFSVKQASFHTGYNVETIEKLLERFRKMGKIKTSRKTKELLIIKFFYHNVTKSETVKTHCKGLLNGVKDTALIPYIYGIDTLDIGSCQEEEEKEEEESASKIPSKESFIAYALSKKPSLDVESVELKYDAWVEAGWHNGKGNKIMNWKSTLNNTIPYLKERPKNRFDEFGERLKEQNERNNHKAES